VTDKRKKSSFFVAARVRRVREQLHYCCLVNGAVGHTI